MSEEQLIFISHSTKDKPVADAITHSLEARGIHCWIAPRDIRPGKEYGSQIVEGIQRCSTMVLVLSKNSNLSRHIHSEIDRAFSFGKTIIPFRTEESILDPALEYYLSNTHWLDAITPPMEEHIDRLGDTLLGIVTTTHRENLATPPKKKIFHILASLFVILSFIGILLVIKISLGITHLTPPQSVPSSSGSAPDSVSTASYTPPVQSIPATPTSPATVTQSQINAMKTQTGGNVISAVPIAPSGIAPSQKEPMALDPSDLPTKDQPGVIRHQDFGPKPENPNN